MNTNNMNTTHPLELAYDVAADALWVSRDLPRRRTREFRACLARWLAWDALHNNLRLTKTDISRMTGYHPSNIIHGLRQVVIMSSDRAFRMDVERAQVELRKAFRAAGRAAGTERQTPPNKQ